MSYSYFSKDFYLAPWSFKKNILNSYFCCFHSSSSREGAAKDTDSISSGSDDSGHVKNIDDKIKTSTNSSTSATLKNVEMRDVTNKMPIANTSTIKKPPRKSRLPEPVTHFAQTTNRHSYAGQASMETNEFMQEESFQSPTRRYKKNTEVIQVRIHFRGNKSKQRSSLPLNVFFSFASFSLLLFYSSNFDLHSWKCFDILLMISH
jgi:hypothetical protein